MRDFRDRIWNGSTALGYLRCSKDEQEESTEGQHRLVGTELARRGMGFLAPPFTDDGRRGSDEERPGLLALLDYCRGHRNAPRTHADYVPIFIQSIDRVGRFLDPMKIFTYLNELKELGYDVYSLTERLSYVGSTIGEWIQYVVRSDQATGYSVRLSHDSMRGGIQTAEKGFLAGGSPGYGYDRAVIGPDGKARCRYVNLPGKRVAKYAMDGTPHGTLEPLERKGKLIAPTLDKSNVDHVTRIPGDPARVGAVERIFELFEEGIGFRSIAGKLNAEGFPPPRGRKWIVSSVRFILTNPIYMGTAVYGKRSKSKYHEFSIDRDGDRNRIAIEKKEIFRQGFVYRQTDECVVVEDAHPALVSKERWRKCQEILASKAKGTTPKRTGRGARSKYLLTGLVKCARCGYSFQGDTHRRTGWRSYQCGGYVAGGRSVCQRSNVSAGRIEDWIVGEMQNRLLDGRSGIFESYEDFEKAIAEEILAQSRQEPAGEDPKKRIESAVAEKRKKIELVLTGLAEDNLDVANDMIRALKREIATLEAELRRHDEVQRPRVALEPKEVAREAAQYLWHLKEVLEEGTIEERRKFVEFFVEGVKVNGAEGWVETTFYESPTLPISKFPFCIMPPRGPIPKRKKIPCRRPEGVLQLRA